jgi:hypothetical protein
MDGIQQNMLSEWVYVSSFVTDQFYNNPTGFSFAAGLIAAAFIIYGIKGFAVLEERFKARKIKDNRIERGRLMTTPERENHLKILMADAVTDSLEELEYQGKITRDEKTLWYRRFGNLLNLPDLLTKHEKILKDTLRKKYPKGKIITTTPLPLPDVLAVPRRGILSRLKAQEGVPTL